MKKTIIAMLALSGVAFGADADFVQSNLETYIERTEYKAGTADEAGTAFTLELVIGEASNNDYGSGSLIKFTDRWSLYTQAGTFLGFEAGNDGIETIVGGLVGQSSSNTTYDTVGGLALTSGTDEGWFFKPGTCDGLRITLQGLTTGQGLINIWNTDNKGILLMTSIDVVDLSQFKLNNGSYDQNGVFLEDAVSSYTTAKLTIGETEYDLTTAAPAIPEPTTATLSLLALAGLAARRRRK